MIPTPTGNQVVSVPPGLAPGQQFRVPVPAAPQQLLNVQVPPGIGPGQQLTVRAPNGQLFMATVPPGHTTGSTFQMAIPRGAGPAPGPAGNAGPGLGAVPPPPQPAVNPAEIKEQAVGWKETAGVLEMMLGSLEAGENVQGNELIQELVEQCQTASRMSQRIMEDVTDEAAMMAVLEANDVVMTALSKYEAVLVGGSAAAAPPPPPSSSSGGSESQPAWLAENLGGDGESFPGAQAPSNPPPPQPVATHIPLAPPPQPAKSRAPPVQEEEPPNLLNLEPEAKPTVTPAAAKPSAEAELEAMFGNAAPTPAFPMQPAAGQGMWPQGTQPSPGGLPTMQQPTMGGLPTMQQPTMGIGAMGSPLQTNPIVQPQKPTQKPTATPAIPASNLTAEADAMLMTGPGVAPMGQPATMTSNPAAQKDTAALDAEANDLLAEFDDLIGSMETTGMGVPPAAPNHKSMTDK